MAEIELHFQEVFSGETVRISRNGNQIGERKLKTRFQTGLAHIEKIEVDLGDTIKVEIVEKSVSSSIKIADNTVDYAVTFDGNAINIKSNEDRLRYM